MEKMICDTNGKVTIIVSKNCLDFWFDDKLIFTVTLTDLRRGNIDRSDLIHNNHYLIIDEDILELMSKEQRQYIYSVVGN